MRRGMVNAFGLLSAIGAALMWHCAAMGSSVEPGQRVISRPPPALPATPNDVAAPLLMVTPSGGPITGGNTVTIVSPFIGDLAVVLFGTTAASGVTTNGNVITCTAPAGNGTVDVAIASLDLQLIPSAKNAYTYSDTATYLGVTDTAPGNGIADSLDKLMSGGSGGASFGGVTSNGNFMTLGLSKMQVRVNLASASSAAPRQGGIPIRSPGTLVSVQAAIKIPAGVSLLDAQVGVAVADVARLFKLDAKGAGRLADRSSFKVSAKMKNGTTIADPKNDAAKCIVKLVLYQADVDALIKDGLLDQDTPKTGITVSVPVTVLVAIKSSTSTSYTAEPPLTYKAKKGKTGIGKYPQ